MDTLSRHFHYWLLAYAGTLMFIRGPVVRWVRRMRGEDAASRVDTYVPCLIAAAFGVWLAVAWGFLYGMALWAAILVVIFVDRHRRRRRARTRSVPASGERNTIDPPP